MKKAKQLKQRSSFFFIFIAALMLLPISGCAIDMTTYADNRPVFDLFNYFSGTTRGWGIVQDRKGELLRQFVVTIEGTRNAAGELILDETFYWSDGEISERTWVIAREDRNRFTGSAGDVIGSAQGQSVGNVLNWHYQVEIPVSDTTWNISFDDWMFLQPDGVLLNRAQMSKFGFRVGEETIAFIKTPAKEN